MTSFLQFVPVIPVAFLFGASIGSFLNVVTLRFGTQLHLSNDRSRCPNCGYQLRWYDLLPILSFMVLRGQCRSCHNPISVQYPLVESAIGLAAVIFAASLLQGTMNAIEVSILFGIVCILSILFVIDWNTFLLPDYYIIILTIIALVRHLITFKLSAYDVAGGALIGSGFLLLLWLVTRGKGIGFGDVKLMIPLGILFGLQGTIILVFLSFISGGLVGSVLLLLHKATPKTAIPFGPYLTGVAILLIMFPRVSDTLIHLFLTF